MNYTSHNPHFANEIIMIQNLQFNLPNYIVPRGAMQAMLRRLIREPSSSFFWENLQFVAPKAWLEILKNDNINVEQKLGWDVLYDGSLF